MQSVAVALTWAVGYDPCVRHVGLSTLPSGPPSLQVSRMHAPVSVLGPGQRVGLWVQGCSIGCKGCVSQDTWAADGGAAWHLDRLLERIGAWRTEGCTGLTISGGEPFDQPEALAALATEIRARWADFDVLAYSGYGLRWLQRHRATALSTVDAVLTGPFIAAQETDLVWRGSANQVLTPLTALGETRFASHVGRRRTQPDLQVAVDDGVWMIGVPGRGDLARVEDRLAKSGITLLETSWSA